ncbi:MAG TPA: hypothetical protein VHO71_00890 [Caproiciproducens sp.]|nr:hypothetical protein [Caproiciproducens sp.]
MNREKLSQAIGEIDLRYVGEAMAPRASVNRKAPHSLPRFWKERRVAACICIVLLALSITFGTAFAASPAFRQTIISVFFPAYTGNEIQQIDEGHMTGSFDKEDVLSTFLDKFNNQKMEAGLTVKKDHGYHYTLLPDQNGTTSAIVDCNRSDHKLLVTMKLKPYLNTTGLWQVTSYQVIDSKTAKAMLSK